MKELRKTVEKQEETLKKLNSQITQLQRKLTTVSAYASKNSGDNSASWKSLIPMVTGVVLMLIIIIYISSLQSRLSQLQNH